MSRQTTILYVAALSAALLPAITTAGTVAIRDAAADCIHSLTQQDLSFWPSAPIGADSTGPHNGFAVRPSPLEAAYFDYQKDVGTEHRFIITGITPQVPNCSLLNVCPHPPAREVVVRWSNEAIENVTAGTPERTPTPPGCAG